MIVVADLDVCLDADAALAAAVVDAAGVVAMAATAVDTAGMMAAVAAGAVVAVVTVMVATATMAITTTGKSSCVLGSLGSLRSLDACNHFYTVGQRIVFNLKQTKFSFVCLVYKVHLFDI